MRYPICTAATVIVLMSSSFLTTTYAAPYQLQADIKYAETDVSVENSNFFDSSDQKETEKKFQLSYYLLPITSSNGPLNERAFLSKSAFLFGAISESETQGLESTELLALQARFVTQTQLVFGVAYDKTDRDSADRTDISFELGRYLGERSLFLVSFESSEGSSDTESQTITASYRQLLNGASPNTYLAFEVGLEYIDLDFGLGDTETGYQLNIDNRYYFSDRLSIGASLSHSDVGFSNETLASVNSAYFFTENFSGEFAFSRRNIVSGISIDTAAVTVSTRF